MAAFNHHLLLIMLSFCGISAGIVFVVMIGSLFWPKSTLQRAEARGVEVAWALIPIVMMLALALPALHSILHQH